MVFRTPARRRCFLSAPVAAAALLTGLGLQASAQSTPSPSPRKPFNAFALYVLSKGKGVPPEADEALRKVRALVNADRDRGVAVKVESKPLGIEGEMRLCAEYERADEAGRAYDKAKAMAEGVPLTNLVVEPCAQKEGRKP
jgi:hypothetical protein